MPSRRSRSWSCQSSRPAARQAPAARLLHPTEARAASARDAPTRPVAQSACARATATALRRRKRQAGASDSGSPRQGFPDGTVLQELLGLSTTPLSARLSPVHALLLSRASLGGSRSAGTPLVTVPVTVTREMRSGRILDTPAACPSLARPHVALPDGRRIARSRPDVVIEGLPQAWLSTAPRSKRTCCAGARPRSGRRMQIEHDTVEVLAGFDMAARWGAQCPWSFATGPRALAGRHVPEPLAGAPNNLRSSTAPTRSR